MSTIMKPNDNEIEKKWEEYFSKLDLEKLIYNYFKWSVNVEKYEDVIIPIKIKK